VAHGPKRADAIAAGYTFTTDADNGAYSILSDDLAPSGYAYLLIASGRGTIATCMFDDFHNEQEYLNRTVEAFKKKVDFEMENKESFGGTGNIFMDPKIRKGKLLYAGEAAGFQDALFGFGMRYAMRSGYHAAKTLVEGSPEEYEKICKQHLFPMQKRSVVNRYLYDKFRSTAYRYLLKSLERADDPRRWMKNYYQPHWLKNLLYPLARRAFVKTRELIPSHKEGCDCTYCDCTYCRCERERDAQTTDPHS
ncbi:MAG: NAD(P)/FAD-dependent oxidoreductase, partial [bacterium]